MDGIFSVFTLWQSDNLRWAIQLELLHCDCCGLLLGRTTDNLIASEVLDYGQGKVLIGCNDSSIFKTPFQTDQFPFAPLGWPHRAFKVVFWGS